MLQNYPQYKQKIVTLATWSGRIILIEEALNSSTSKLYYGLEPQQFFDINFLQEDELNNSAHQIEFKKSKIFRTYEKMVTIQNQLYLFHYVDAQAVEKRITEARNQKESLTKKVVNDFLGKLLDALYQLHSMQILGRQFSTSNVLEDKNGQILMMDFGFAPDFYQADNYILHPPEIFLKLLNRNQQTQESKLYNTTIDSWLLGAFLYNLLRLKPITLYKYSNLTDYILEHQKLIEQKQTHISAKTQRYEGEGICEFIDQLLVFKPRDRLTFLQIHQSEYVKNLNLPKHHIYEKYYKENENNATLMQKIAKRENAQSLSLFISNDLCPPKQSEIEDNQFQNLIPPNLPLDSKVGSANVKSIVHAKQDIEQQNDSNIVDVTISFYYHAVDIRNSKYFSIWEYINMEQYRCYMLDNTSQVVVTNLDSKFQLQDLTSYFLKKMSHLILIELLKNLKKEKCPWKVQQELWKSFRDDNQKKILEAKLISQITQQELELKQLGEKVYQKYIQNEKLDKCIINSLQNDYLSKFDFSNYTSDQFIKQGFRLITTNLHKYLCQESNVYDEMKVNYYGMILKAVFCHLINRSLNLDDINAQFFQLKPNLPNEKLTPNDINEFIHSKDNDKPKIKQINFLMNKYFPKE